MYFERTEFYRGIALCPLGPTFPQCEAGKGTPPSKATRDGQDSLSGKMMGGSGGDRYEDCSGAPSGVCAGR